MKYYWTLGWLSLAIIIARGQGPSLEESTLLGLKGRVELMRSGAKVWDPAQTNIVLRSGDQLRTFEGSRATLRLRDATIVNAGELTTLRVASEQGRSLVDLVRGVLSFFHRDRPGDSEVRGGGASAIIRGTEFAAIVDAQNRMSLVMFEGSAELTNALGGLLVTAGDEATVSAAAAPRKTPGLGGTNRSAVQWTLYYPAILDPSGVNLDDSWKPILELYSAGDFWRASELARARGEPKSGSERIFMAALRLSLGDVPGMIALTQPIEANSREALLAAALRTVARAAQFEPCESTDPGATATATEWLASSYCRQSRGENPAALLAARRAAQLAPEFGVAQARVAELEFAGGNVETARDAVAKARRLSPKLAAAASLEGFLLAARGRHAEARARFDEAIALDSGFADAWLGRGLVRFHSGDRVGGRVDIEAATAIEPQRSVLRSYLGKAFAEEGNDDRALAELALADRLDARDPTALLYRALISARRYEIADAIADIDESVNRNDNRAVYRSRMLLDQDAAVRGANLARILELADMPDVARRESARAVMFDYANYSAHLNLAASFNALRDPTRVNLRNETVWLNEHLLASLLAPADGAPLSQNLSQNEYSRLFGRDHFGFSSTTEYTSAWEVRQLATHTWNSDRISYALDLDSNWKGGERPNQDLSRIEWYSRAKISLTPDDSLLLLVKYEDFESGDNFQYADQTLARPSFRFRETQTPIFLAGFHHEWHPGSRTLVLAGRLQNEQSASDQAWPETIAISFPPADPATAGFGASYENQFVIYSGEVNQILEAGPHTTVLGGRFQKGAFDAAAELDDAPGGFGGLFGGITQSRGDGDFQRGSFYLYHTWEIIPDLRVTGGMSYDSITSPVNFRIPPLQSGEIDNDRWSPKAALIYSPSPVFTVRGMYAQSLGGVSYDESITIEPTQLAGFPQAFRSLISESLVGSVEVPRHDAGGIGFDFKFPSRTYLSVDSGEIQGVFQRLCFGDHGSQ